MDAERREQPPDVFQFIIHDDDHDEDRRARDVELLIDPKYFPLSLPRSLHLTRGLIIGQQAANKRLTPSAGEIAIELPSSRNLEKE